MLEALACGTPVVAFKSSGGCEAVLQDALFGALAEYADIKTYTSYLRRYLSDDREVDREKRAIQARDTYCWRDYVFNLLRLGESGFEKTIRSCS